MLWFYVAEMYRANQYFVVLRRSYDIHHVLYATRLCKHTTLLHISAIYNAAAPTQFNIKCITKHADDVDYHREMTTTNHVIMMWFFRDVYYRSKGPFILKCS